MKRITGLLIVISLLLTSCSYSLGEVEGAFNNPNYEVPVEQICNHSFLYDMPTNYDSYGIYPNAEYHYVQCTNHLYGGTCDFEPTFDKHTRKFSGFEDRPVVMYNGHYYHIAKFSCTVCGSVFAGTEYVLCSNDSSECKCDCANALEYWEEEP